MDDSNVIIFFSYLRMKEIINQADNITPGNIRIC